MELARRLIDVAAEAGADAVKFQSFRAEALASRHAPKAAYQARETGAGQSQLEMLKALELSDDDHGRLVEHCGARGIEFMSTPFDHHSLALLLELGVRRIKIGSGDLTNAPLLLAAAQAGKPLILSTGMATLAEIEQALGVVAFGMSRSAAAPGVDAFRAAWAEPALAAAVRREVTVLQCVTEYPAPPSDVNLAAMATIHDAFGVRCGYSDHTLGIEISLAAVALGASVIEKHFTTDRSLTGPDHRASLEPEELRRLVAGIRAVEQSLGSGNKQPAPSETPNIAVARKSLVAARAIRKGRKLTVEDVAVKRPGTGTPPVYYWDWIGRIAERDYEEDDPL
jgi:N-acetylneuraminate synthase